MTTESITITDSLGTFQAENPDTIPATIRKRRKERERLEKIQFEQHEKARTIATVRGFHVLSMLREPSRNKRGVAVLQNIDAEKFPVLRVEPKRGRYSAYSVETENGSAVVSFDCMERITQTVIDAMGFPWLLFTVDDYENRGTIRAYSIGVFQDSHCLVSLPNVTPADFKEPKPGTLETLFSELLLTVRDVDRMNSELPGVKAYTVAPEMLTNCETALRNAETVSGC